MTISGLSASIGVAVRFLLLAGALIAPLAALNGVQQSDPSTIESLHSHSSGAGLVIVFGLQRS